MSENAFDVIFIGAGPGGYVGAIRSAQLGLKTAVIEKDKTLGGTCLNVGCIPSKALLESSEIFHAAGHTHGEHGVVVKEPKLDLKTMLGRKDKIVSDLTGGIEYLFKKNNITWLKGTGKLISNTQVQVKGADGKAQEITAKNIVLATGSVPNIPPMLKVDGQKIVTSTEALSFANVPDHLIVIGAGAIGLEMGSVWLRLGSKVTVIEYNSKICGAMDLGMSKRMLAILKKQGMEFILEASVSGADIGKKSVKVNYTENATKAQKSIEGDIVLVATGRKAFSEGLGLEDIGIQKNERGVVKVNDHYQTKFPNVYAIGDLIPGPMLAHKAEEEGVAVAEIIAGQAGHVNYETVPNVIYTWPEMASVGLTEEELKAKGIAFKAGAFPFSANARAKAGGMTEGQVKILADATTDKVLGVHMVGPKVSELIAEAVIAMEFSASAEDIARSFHAHPTLAEVIREAALAVDKRQRQM